MFQTRETKQALLRKSGIYKITLIGTPRSYIGQAANLWKRMRSHLNEANSTNLVKKKCKIHNAIRRHGAEAFEFSVLAFCDVGNLNGLEEWFILRFNSAGSEGFNIRELPGLHKSGRVTSDEARAKIAHANTGKKRSPETIERMRKAALKKPPISDETRAKMRASQKGKNRSDAWKEKLRQRMRGNTYRKGVSSCRPVQQIDESTGEVIATHASVAEAAKAMGVKMYQIAYALRGRPKSHHGFAWRYLPASTN